MKPSTIARALGRSGAAVGAGWILYSGYMMFSPIWRHGGANSVRDIWIASGHVNYSVRSNAGGLVYTVNTMYWISILVAIALIAVGVTGSKRGAGDRA